MKTKSIVLIVVSLGFGCIAAIGMVQVMAKSKSAGPRANTHPVLVALTDLDINDELTPENVKVEQWPANMIPEGVVTKWEGNEGRRVAGRVVKGFPIQADMLLQPGESSGLKIRDGYKVIAIKASDQDTFYGLLSPGARVDIIGLFKKTGTKQEIAKTFLKNIRVFAVNDQTSRTPGKEEGSKDIRVVQLEVTNSQAEKIALVQGAGALRLVLSSDLDQQQFDADRKSASEDEPSLEELLGTANESAVVSDENRDEEQQDSMTGKLIEGLIGAWNAQREANKTKQVSDSDPGRPHMMTMISAEGTYVYTWDNPNHPPRMSELPPDPMAHPTTYGVPTTRISAPKPRSGFSDNSGSNAKTDNKYSDDSDAGYDQGHEDW